MSASTEEEKDEWIKCIQQSISHNPFYDMLAARKKKAQKNSPWREVSLNDWVISGTDLTDEYCTDRRMDGKISAELGDDLANSSSAI